MRTFVDTSALYALLDGDDDQHGRAARWFTAEGADPETLLVTHNYVVVETAALVQRRLGQEAVRALLDDFVPAMSVFYVDESLHRAATAALRTGGPRISLVDHTSFEFIRSMQLEQAFAFDSNFEAQGFATVP